MWKITVEKDKCNGCGECIDSCPGDVFELIGNTSQPVHVEECHGCHTCEAVCEQDACHVEEQ